MENFTQEAIENRILVFFQDTVCSTNVTCDGYVNTSYQFYLTYVRNIID